LVLLLVLGHASASRSRVLLRKVEKIKREEKERREREKPKRRERNECLETMGGTVKPTKKRVWMRLLFLTTFFFPFFANSRSCVRTPHERTGA